MLENNLIVAFCSDPVNPVILSKRIRRDNGMNRIRIKVISSMKKIKNNPVNPVNTVKKELGGIKKSKISMNFQIGDKCINNKSLM